MADRPNRQQRRAAERRRNRVVPMVRVGDLTLPEAELHAEAMDAYVRSLDAELPADVGLWTAQQTWARARAVQLREMYQGTVEPRPVPNDAHGQRLPGA